MTDTMRERLARAAAEHAGYDWGHMPEQHKIGYMPFANRQRWYELVDVILTELREPSERMIEAVGGSPFALPRDIWRQEAVTVWQAMLDAIREEQP